MFVFCSPYMFQLYNRCVLGSLKRDKDALDVRRWTMGRRSVGLQKELSTIFEGVRVPGKTAAEGSVCTGRPERMGETLRPDPIALFEKIARMQRRRLSVWSRLRNVFLRRVKAARRQSHSVSSRDIQPRG